MKLAAQAGEAKMCGATDGGPRDGLSFAKPIMFELRAPILRTDSFDQLPMTQSLSSGAFPRPVGQPI
jgi:hypothetical protein